MASVVCEASSSGGGLSEPAEEQTTKETIPEESSWIDDLPSCHLSGVGFVSNTIYRRDGQPSHEHNFEDACIRLRSASDISLYCVIDGHDGRQAAEYVAQKLPEELLLDQLDNIKSDEGIIETLRQVFSAVERGYFVSIGDVLAKRAELLIKIPENMNAYESTQKFPHEMSLINELGERVSSGCAIVLALVKKDKLYVANVGNSRAVLCSISGNGLVVQQLSVDHDIDNPDEVMRLTKLGLNLDAIRHFSHTTRCLGDFPRKGGYKDFELFSTAKSEPVISDPTCTGGIAICKSFCFLILMSSGVYLNMENATGTTEVNEDIAYMVAREFSRQTTETSVAQAVLDEIGRLHQEAFLNAEVRSPFCHKREDMTLLVRRFDGAASCAASLLRREQNYSDALPNFNTLTAPSTNASCDSSNTEEYELPLNESGELEPYVDFSEYYAAIENGDEQLKILDDLTKDL